MRIVVVGATGFVGRHLVASLLERGNTVVAVARSRTGAENLDWLDRVTFVADDFSRPNSDLRTVLGEADAVVHLAWPGLPNYKSLFHFEENLPSSYRFLKQLVLAGYQRIVVAGTCFEYGMQSGCLNENLDPRPTNAYGIAKNTLRMFLESLRREHEFCLQWPRLFYMYGEGQNPNSLMGQLERALAQRESVLDMSGGEQLRDYLPVVEVAEKLSTLIECPNADGVVNICSGRPISVRRLVEEYLDKKGVPLRLNFGVYPYPDHEPFAFWGDCTKFNFIEAELKTGGA